MVEGARLEIVCTCQRVPRVRIPFYPPIKPAFAGIFIGRKGFEPGKWVRRRVKGGCKDAGEAFKPNERGGRGLSEPISLYPPIKPAFAGIFIGRKGFEPGKWVRRRVKGGCKDAGEAFKPNERGGRGLSEPISYRIRPKATRLCGYFY